MAGLALVGTNRGARVLELGTNGCSDITDNLGPYQKGNIIPVGIICFRFCVIEVNQSICFPVERCDRGHWQFLSWVIIGRRLPKLRKAIQKDCVHLGRQIEELEACQLLEALQENKSGRRTQFQGIAYHLVYGSFLDLLKACRE